MHEKRNFVCLLTWEETITINIQSFMTPMESWQAERTKSLHQQRFFFDSKRSTLFKTNGFVLLTFSSIDKFWLLRGHPTLILDIFLCWKPTEQNCEKLFSFLVISYVNFTFGPNSCTDFLSQGSN